MELPELNSAMFVRENHVNEYGHLLGMVGAKYREHLIEKAYRKRHPEEFVEETENGKRD